MFIVMMLTICSMSFISCKAITAQNIKSTDSSQGMNDGPRGPEMDDNTNNTK